MSRGIMLPGTMPSPRWLLLSVLLLVSCGKSPLEQRIEQIRQLSNRQDYMFRSAALGQVERKYWTLRGRDWFGKLPDGTLVCLESPDVIPQPLPSRAFYSGWHLQLTVFSANWRADPAAPAATPFEAVYAITRHSATYWDIRVTSGPITAPVKREDAARAGALEN